MSDDVQFTQFCQGKFFASEEVFGEKIPGIFVTFFRPYAFAARG
jgi:hypothetical protein